MHYTSDTKCRSCPENRALFLGRVAHCGRIRFFFFWSDLVEHNRILHFIIQLVSVKVTQDERGGDEEERKITSANGAFISQPVTLSKRVKFRLWCANEFPMRAPKTKTTTARGLRQDY